MAQSLAPSVDGSSSTDLIKSRLRVEASALFAKEQYSKAKILYWKEWRSKCTTMISLGSLSCDASAALKQLGRTSEAMAASTASIILDPSNIKAWIRRCDLLEIISGPERALIFLQALREDWSQDNQN